MRTIAIINQKGGCGKTTTAINLAGVLARQGRRTLLVDLDPQSHCAAGLAIPEARIDVQIGDAMLAKPDQSIDWTRLLWRVSRHLDLAPSTVRLAALESARGGLASQEGAELRLGRVLRRLADQYEFCLIDCPPNIGLLTYNALAAANEVLIPVETAFFSLQGASKQLATIRSVAKRLSVAPTVHVLPTMHEAGSTLAGDVLDELTRRFGDTLCPVVIRHDVKLKEAVSFGQPIIDYAAESAGAHDYLSLATWLMTDASRLPGRDEPTAAGFGEGPTSGAFATGPAHQPERSSPFVSGLLAEDPMPRGVKVALEPVILQTSSPVPVGAPSLNARDLMTATIAAPARPAMLTETKPAPVDQTDLRARLMELSGRVSRLAERTRFANERHPEPAVRVRGVDVPDASPVLGARQTSTGVLFVQPGDARSIHIAGEFNGWSATATPMMRNAALGVFERVVPLPPGRWAYRLVIDGRWTHDIHNPVCQPNPFGELNSIVDVTQRTGL